MTTLFGQPDVFERPRSLVFAIATGFSLVIVLTSMQIVCLLLNGVNRLHIPTAPSGISEPQYRVTWIAK